MLAWFRAFSLAEFMGLLALVNAAMYLGSLGVVAILQRLFASRLLNRGPAPIVHADVLLSLVIAAINTLVGLPGWWLWRSGHVQLREPQPLAALADLALLVICFDAVMYALHRVMHAPFLYALAHARHHQHRDVSGLSFFVMNPIEAVGFGALLVAVLLAKPFDLAALLGFLLLNWLYGTLGHSGLRFESRLLLWLAGDSVFHHRHHQTGRGNFGFFTPVWDRLLGTEIPVAPPLSHGTS